jgi:short-subunit dehydrogenase
MTAHGMRRVAIFGATSGIATAVARRLAGEGGRLLLAGRDVAGLEAAAADLRVRGAQEVVCLQADFAALEALPGLARSAWAALAGSTWRCWPMAHYRTRRRWRRMAPWRKRRCW